MQHRKANTITAVLRSLNFHGAISDKEHRQYIAEFSDYRRPFAYKELVERFGLHQVGDVFHFDLPLETLAA